MKWISVEDRLPPTGKKVLVKKHYLDNEFDLKKGGYTNKTVKTESTVELDSFYGVDNPTPLDGGIVTHFYEYPEPPNERP